MAMQQCSLLYIIKVLFDYQSFILYLHTLYEEMYCCFAYIFILYFNSRYPATSSFSNLENQELDNQDHNTSYWSVSD